MANENWKPGTGKAIPTNTPIKVDPKFNTITSSNLSGYIPFEPNRTGATRPYYAINNDGIVTFKYGPGPSTQPFQADVENTLNDFASKTDGAQKGQGVANRTLFQTALQSTLEAQAPNLGVTPTGTLPPPAAAPGTTPAAAPANTPGSAAAGPNSNIIASGNLGEFTDALTNLQKGQDPGSYGTWYYPENIASRGQDRVFIQMIKYVTPDIAQSGSAFAGALSNRESQFANESTKEKQLGSVTLPMTNNLTEAVEVDWGSDKLSSIAAGLMAGGINVVNKAAGGDVLGALNDVAGTAGALLGNRGISGRAQQYIATKAAAGLISGVGFQINPESYITRRTGTVPNPNLELLFNGPKLKAFGLSFKLTPRSEKEAIQIRNIIKFFKKGMAPIRGNDQQNSFFLGTPNVFRVRFLPSENSSDLLSLPQFKTCALVTCGVNYTPDGLYAAYEDSKVTSQPVSVTLQLGFSELTPLYNSDYEFPEKERGSVGPDRKLFEDVAIKDITPSSAPAATPTGQPTAQQRRVAGQALLNSGAGATPAQTLIRPAN